VAKKNPKNVERRAMVEQMRKEQARKERNRSMLILGVCVVAVLGLLGAALVPYLKDRNEDKALADKSITKIGVSEAAASCDDILTKPTDKSQNHVPDGPITYEDAPPAFGNHRPVAAAFERKFYTADDRPEVAQLVHNLEHGYTILWYDDTVADDRDQLKDIEAIAKKYDDVRFIAAPWTKDDGDAFPDGKHIALTRWSADAEKPSDQDKQRGNWQYCGSTSGSVVADFVKKWPNEESPEPNTM
jgi:hypothetical protein